MSLTSYNFEKLCQPDRLAQEITESEIVTALSHIETATGPDSTTVWFKAALSANDQTLLTTIVTDHVNSPLPDDAQLVALDGPKDTDGSSIYRPKTTQTGWHFEPRCITWKASTVDSLHNKKASGLDHGDAVLKFWDVNRVELVQGGEETGQDFQTRITANARFTVMDWWPQEDVDIIGGTLFVKNVTADPARAYIIAAPAIPVESGGNIALNTGGFDLSFFYDSGLSKNTGQFINNGRGVKTLAYDAVYRSNELRFLLEHPAGYAASAMIMYEVYKA